MAKVIVIGPAYPLRGGLATFDERLARQFNADGDDCTIYSFSLQYPGFLFPGTTQFSSEPPPADLKILTVINSINPLNWLRVRKKLKKESADIIVVRYWLPFMGPALGTILRVLKHARRKGTTRVICIADNVIPHEHRPGDKSFTRYFLKACDGFVTMSDKVKQDLEYFNNRKPVRVVPHPLYDNFGAILDKKTARQQLSLDPERPVILFFGFIRNYKGLDLLLEAYALLQENFKGDPATLPLLLIAGEFYEDRKPYDALIAKLQIGTNLSLHTAFVPDSEVRYFLCAADVVVQPYRNATQSGVTPLAYYFEKPMIVTNVGGLPALVPHEKVGLVAEPDAASIAAAITRFYQLGENYFLPHLREEKKKYSWENLVNAIRELAQS